MVPTRFRRCCLFTLMAVTLAGLAACDGASNGSGVGEDDAHDADDSPSRLAASPSSSGPAPDLGIWRATVELPDGGDLPFRMRLAQTAQGLSATVLNGDERVPVGEVSLDGSRLLLNFPAFNNRIEAVMEDAATLRGELTLVKRGGVTQVMPFTAHAGDDYRFLPDPTPNVDVTGRWAVTFTDDDGDTAPAVGEFAQDEGRLTGTFLTPTGDYRYLAGEVDGDTMYLSTFDGSHAFLFRARMSEDGTLAGDFWSGTKWHEQWKARRDESAALPDPETLTFLKPGYDRFEFSFPDEQGNPVSLDDPRFAGKVVLVTLAGSWCPNCHDEASYLAEYYREHAGEGVEVVCLMYEHFEDFDIAAGQVKRFREKFGIEYTTLIAGISAKDEAAKTLPMLNRVLAFPTTIYLDRKGEVRKIHTGFSGPGTGEHFEAWDASFRSFVAELLGETA
jgi:thiol-disulfide isomerase/thioredoxin